MQLYQSKWSIAALRQQNICWYTSLRIIMLCSTPYKAGWEIPEFFPKTMKGKLATKVHWMLGFWKLATYFHIKNSFKIDGMVTVCQCCTSKQDKFSNSFSLKSKLLKELKNLVLMSKQFWISITKIRTRQQLKTEVWREADNTRKIFRDYISGNLKCMLWKR